MEQEWKPDTDWTLISSQMKCRSTTRVGKRPVSCQGQAVAMFRRRYKNGTHHWWAYCADHLYGREIRDGAVMHLVYLEN